MQIQSYACTHIGRRPNNEDAYLVSAELGLFAVADGMGGYEGGEIASQIAVTTLHDFYARALSDREVTWPGRYDPRRSPGENRLDAAVLLANRQVCARRHGCLERMGSTVAALDVYGGEAVIGHVGDSRVYRFRDGRLEALTRDHSLYAMLQASGAQELPPQHEFGYRNVVTRALGIEDAQPDLRREPLRRGDVFVLCTDGLTERVDEDGIAFLLATRAPADACEAMVDLAFELGARDNITVVVVAVV